MRAEAITNLSTDFQEVFLSCLLNEPYLSVRKQALSKIKLSQLKRQQLYNLVVSGQDILVRQASIQLIEDRKLLVAILKQSHDIKVINRALDKIDDELDLLEIAHNADSVYARYQAANKIEDQDKLEEIVLRSNNYKVVSKLIPRVSNSEILALIRIRDTDKNIRGLVKERLRELKS